MAGLEIIRAGSFRPWLGVFETICVRRGRPLFLEEHWQSLRRACRALGLKRPYDFRAQARELPGGRSLALDDRTAPVPLIRSSTKSRDVSMALR